MLDSNPKCGSSKAKCSLAAWPEGLTVRRRACKGRKPHDFCRVGPKIQRAARKRVPAGLRGQRLGLFLHLVDFPLKSLGRRAVRGLHVIPGQQQRREDAPIECKLKEIDVRRAPRKPWPQRHGRRRRQSSWYPIPPESDTCQLMMTALMQCGGNRTKARLLLSLNSQNSTG